MDSRTYVRLNDGLPEHRKIVAAGGDAAWLYICSLAYASRNLTDGIIPQAVVARLSDRKQPAKLAAKLTSVGLWHVTGHNCDRCPQPDVGTYAIHDYLEHQPSAEIVMRRVRPAIPADIRTLVFERDEHTCVECGATEDLTLDHIYPWSLGGPDTPENLRVLRRPCNSRKGARV